MPSVHRHSDSRSCGATTVVTGQSTVFSDDLLWAVDGDPNNHGSGGLIPSGSTVYVEDKLVIVNSPDSANPDSLCPIPGGEHCNPKTASGSGSVSAY